MGFARLRCLDAALWMTILGRGQQGSRGLHRARLEKQCSALVGSRSRFLQEGAVHGAPHFEQRARVACTHRHHHQQANEASPSHMPRQCAGPAGSGVATGREAGWVARDFTVTVSLLGPTCRALELLQRLGGLPLCPLGAFHAPASRRANPAGGSGCGRRHKNVRMGLKAVCRLTSASPRHAQHVYNTCM